MRRALTISVLTGFLMLEAFASTPSAQSQTWLVKVAPILQQRLTQWLGRSRVVMTATDQRAMGPLAAIVEAMGGHVLRTLPIVNGLEADLPHFAISTIANISLVQHMSIDRLAVGSLERTGLTIGATAGRGALGYDGTGARAKL